MSQFRKKPVVIEAVQYEKNGKLALHEAPVWLWEALESGVAFNRDGRLILKTLEGEHVVSDGDWIVRGVKGELYPCKPDIFALTYESVVTDNTLHTIDPASSAMCRYGVRGCCDSCHDLPESRAARGDAAPPAVRDAETDRIRFSRLLLSTPGVGWADVNDHSPRFVALSSPDGAVLWYRRDQISDDEPAVVIRQADFDLLRAAARAAASPTETTGHGSNSPDPDTLIQTCLAVCEQRGWSLHWTARGAYLFLESSELIEAWRGKGKSTVPEEAGDVLLVLFSILGAAKVSWADALACAIAKMEDLKTRPRYAGEEYSATQCRCWETGIGHVPDCPNRMVNERTLTAGRAPEQKPESVQKPEWGPKCLCRHHRITHRGGANGEHCMAFDPGPDMKAIPCACDHFVAAPAGRPASGSSE